jgi:hypothetical protein
VPDPDRPLLLGQERDPAGERVEAGPRRRHHAQQLERGHDPVAGGAVLADDDVPALLAAQAGARHEHRGEDVLVAHGGADDPAAGLLDRVLEAAVGQDRHDEASPVEGVPLEALEREDAEDLVAVDEPPSPSTATHGRRRRRARTRRPPRARRRPPQRRRVGRAAAAVDVVAVGLRRGSP